MILQIIVALSVICGVARAKVTQSCGRCDEPKGLGFNVDYYRIGASFLKKLKYDPQNLLQVPRWAVRFDHRNNVQNINFKISDLSYSSSNGYQCYEVDVPRSHYALVLKGWLLATQSGKYEFKVQGDTLVSFQIGSGQDCHSADFERKVVTQDIKSSFFRNIPVSVSAQLEEGNVYPIRITYFNGGNPNAFHAQYKLPNGVVMETFSDVQQFDESSCNAEKPEKVENTNMSRDLNSLDPIIESISKSSTETNQHLVEITGVSSTPRTNLFSLRDSTTKMSSNLTPRTSDLVILSASPSDLIRNHKEHTTSASNSASATESDAFVSTPSSKVTSSSITEAEYSLSVSIIPTKTGVSRLPSTIVADRKLIDYSSLFAYDMKPSTSEVSISRASSSIKSSTMTNSFGLIIPSVTLLGPDNSDRKHIPSVSNNLLTTENYAFASTPSSRATSLSMSENGYTPSASIFPAKTSVSKPPSELFADEKFIEYSSTVKFHTRPNSFKKEIPATSLLKFSQNETMNLPHSSEFPVSQDKKLVSSNPYELSSSSQNVKASAQLRNFLSTKSSALLEGPFSSEVMRSGGLYAEALSKMSKTVDIGKTITASEPKTKNGLDKPTKSASIGTKRPAISNNHKTLGKKLIFSNENPISSSYKNLSLYEYKSSAASNVIEDSYSSRQIASNTFSLSWNPMNKTGNEIIEPLQAQMGTPTPIGISKNASLSFNEQKYEIQTLIRGSDKVLQSKKYPNNSFTTQNMVQDYSWGKTKQRLQNIPSQSSFQKDKNPSFVVSKTSSEEKTSIARGILIITEACQKTAVPVDNLSGFMKDAKTAKEYSSGDSIIENPTELIEDCGTNLIRPVKDTSFTDCEKKVAESREVISVTKTLTKTSTKCDPGIEKSNRMTYKSRVCIKNEKIAEDSISLSQKDSKDRKNEEREYVSLRQNQLENYSEDYRKFGKGLQSIGIKGFRDLDPVTARGCLNPSSVCYQKSDIQSITCSLNSSQLTTEGMFSDSSCSINECSATSLCFAKSEDIQNSLFTVRLSNGANIKTKKTSAISLLTFFALILL